MANPDTRLLKLYIPVQQAIINHWLGQLGPVPTCVLLFVNERTLRYGKQKEHIPERHFQNGITSKAGKRIHGPLGIKHTAIWKNLKLLREGNLILVETIRDRHVGSIYSVNVTVVLSPVLSGELEQNYDRASDIGRRMRVRKR